MGPSRPRINKPSRSLLRTSGLRAAEQGPGHSRLGVSWGPRLRQATGSQGRVFSTTMTGPDCTLEQSFQFSSENELKGGGTAGSETGWEATTAILVTVPPAPKGSGMRMKTGERTEEETLWGLVTGSRQCKVKTMVPEPGCLGLSPKYASLGKSLNLLMSVSQSIRWGY